MEIGENCKYCSMERNSDDGRSNRQRNSVQIIVDVIIWLSVALPVLFLFLQGTPYDRGFFCDDVTLSYPYRPDTISTPILIVSGFATSIVVVVLIEVLNCVDRGCRRPCQPSTDIVYCLKTYSVFLVGFIIQGLVVEVVKHKMGVLRPNFFDVCKPQFNRTLCPGYISEYMCTESEYGARTIRSSRKSFPSGHSAFSMYIAVFFCIYIQKRLQIHFSRILKFFLQSGLIFTAILCGLGRVKDNKHHPSDVLAGYVVGILVAVFVCKIVGQNILMPTTSIPCSDEIVLERIEKSRDCCCTCEQTPDNEPQTPLPLLPKEYFHHLSTRPEKSSPKLNNMHNNNGRHQPKFVTSTICRLEDV